MTVALRSSATVTNGTAGTSVTVAKPAGTANGDVLVAFIAETGTGSITKPSGWTLIGTVAGGTGVTLGAYWKVAASEGASWTWTLGSSVRNWGSVHSMTGVDTSSPIASSASDGDTGGAIGGLGNDPVSNLPASGYLLTGLAGSATATGSATTWSKVTQTDWDADLVELVDVGTNGGAGTDITGTVLGLPSPERAIADSGWMFASLCSQDQASGAGWSVALNPAAGTAYTGTVPTGVIVKAAFGADPGADPSAWSWTDVTSVVRSEEGIRITKGRNDWASTASPTRVQFSVNNPSGDWTPEHPTGGHYPDIVIDLPIQITMPYGVTGASKRATVFVDGYRPRWDETTRCAVVDISASGRMRRAYKGQQLVPSPLVQSLSGIAPGDYVPQAYWPCEDGSNATQFASAIAGAQPGKSSGPVQLAADSDLLASGPLPVLSPGATATFTVPSYTNTNQWVCYFAMRVPSEPAAETSLAEIRSSGTARRFVYSIAPGTPAELRLKMYDSSGTLLSTTTTALGTNGTPDESEFFGTWCLHAVALADDGFGGGPTGYASVTNTSTFPGLSGSTAGASYGSIQSVKLFAGDGNSAGHVVVFTDPAFNVFGADFYTVAEAFTAYVGETTLHRFARLCTERGIDYDYTWQAFARDGAALSLTPAPEVHTPMGAQPRATLSVQMHDIESTEATLIHDGGPDGELILDVLRDRYNRAVDLTLDMSLGQLALGFEPTYDDQRLVDDVTATNRDGSSYRYATNDSGQHTGTVSVNVSPEEWLAYLAAWTANLGGAAGFRYPKLSLNLRRSPELAVDWLACQISSRVQATNLMSQHPSTTTADVIIEGYTETISSDRWTVDLNVAPYQPYLVYEMEGTGNSGRLDTAGSVLVDAVNSSATSLKFATTSGPLWINSTDRPGDFPFDVGISGQRNTVTAIAKPTIAFVAAGTASTGSSGSRTPGAPAGIASGDLVLIFASTRNSGTGVPDTPSGWSRLAVFEAASNAQLFARIYDGVWSMPTVTYTGGAANEDTIAQSAAFRSNWYSAANAMVAHVSCLNPSAQDITSPGVPITDLPVGFVAVHMGWKQDDFTSTTISGSWTKIQEASTAAGNDASQVWAYRIFTTAPSAGSLQPPITVTGGASAISRGAVAILRADYQVATVTRGVNNVSKSLAAGAPISLWRPGVVAL